MSDTVAATPVFVTAIYDLAHHEANPHRKPIEHYLSDRSCQWVLTLRPLVLFTEERLVERIREKLGPGAAAGENITIIVREFRDLKVFTAVTGTTTPRIPYYTSTPCKDTLSHKQLQWEKFEMVAEVARMLEGRNLVDALVWADFGLGAILHDVPESYPEMAVIRATYPRDKFTCTVINPVTAAEFEDRDTYYERWRYRVAGGFWSVGQEVLPDFLRFVRREIAWLRLEGRTPVDEDIMGRFAYRFPAKCKFYFGDYGSLVANRVAALAAAGVVPPKYDTAVAAQAMQKALLYRPEYLENAIAAATPATSTTPPDSPAAQTPKSGCGTPDTCG